MKFAYTDDLYQHKYLRKYIRSTMPIPSYIHIYIYMHIQTFHRITVISMRVLSIPERVSEWKNSAKPSQWKQFRIQCTNIPVSFIFTFDCERTFGHNFCHFSQFLCQTLWTLHFRPTNRHHRHTIRTGFGCHCNHNAQLIFGRTQLIAMQFRLGQLKRFIEEQKKKTSESVYYCAL